MNPMALVIPDVHERLDRHIALLSPATRSQNLPGSPTQNIGVHP